MSAKKNYLPEKRRLGQYTPNIFSISLGVKNHFKEIESLLSEERFDLKAKLAEGITSEQFAELSARFNIWYNDTSPLSFPLHNNFELEYPLLFSEIRRLLGLLSSLLSDCMSFDFQF